MFHRNKRVILLKASKLHHQQCDVIARVVAIALHFGKQCMYGNTKQHLSKC